MKQTTKHVFSTVILIVLAIVLMFRVVHLVTSAQFQETNLERLRAQWTCSQYNLQPDIEFCGNMLDKDIYTFAGLAYLNGEDPTSSNFEHPPLGKYLLALGIKSGTILLTQYISLFIIAVVTFLLTLKLTHSKLISSFPVVLLFLDPLIFEYGTYIHLEFLQTAFLLIGLYFLLKPPNTKNLLILDLAIGGVLATKVLVTGIIFLVFALAVLTLRSRKIDVRTIVLVLVTAGLVYVLSYWRFFMLHPIWEFITLHIRVVRFFRAYLPEYPWFEIWRILLFGKWRTWFMEPAIQPVLTFWILWPIATIMSFGALIISKFRSNKDFLILAAWALVYLLYQSTHVVFPNYLIQVLPILYVLMIAALFKIISRQWLMIND